MTISPMATINTSFTDPNDADSDDDGLTDAYELNTSSTDPNDADSDDDGLTDGYEEHTAGTNPNNPDTDGDSVADGVEGSLTDRTYTFDPRKDSTEQMQSLKEILRVLPDLMEGEVASYRMGEMSVDVVGGDVSIQIIIEESTNGISWYASTNVIEVVRPASGDAGFYSLEFE